VRQTAGSGASPGPEPGAEVTAVVFLLTGTGVLAREDGTAMWRSLPTPPTDDAAPTPAQLRRAKRAHPAFQGRLPSAGAAFELLREASVASRAAEPEAERKRSPARTGEPSTVEIYDPLTASWSAIPPGVRQARVGETICTVLPDGRFLIGAPAAGPVATFDPVARQWSAAAPPAHERRGGKASFIAVRLRT